MPGLDQITRRILALLEGLAGEELDRLIDGPLDPFGRMSAHLDLADLVDGNGEFSVLRHHFEGFLLDDHADNAAIGKADLGEPGSLLAGAVLRPDVGRAEKETSENEDERRTHANLPCEV